MRSSLPLIPGTILRIGRGGGLGFGCGFFVGVGFLGFFLNLIGLFPSL